jgi:hypothetical protein
MSIQPGVGYTFNASSQGTNLAIERPWAPWANYNLAEDPGHPFKIVNVRIVTAGGSQVVRYQVQSGTINNLVAALEDVTAGNLVLLNRTNPTTGQPNPPTGQVDSAIYDSLKTAYIVMSQGPAIDPPKDYPDPTFSPTSSRYPQIIALDTIPSDVDARGYLCLGTITVDDVTTPTAFSVNQFVTGSLWSDRIKLGTNTATYYYARI